MKVLELFEVVPKVWPPISKDKKKELAKELANEPTQLKNLRKRLHDREDELGHKEAIYMDMEDADADREIKELETAIKKLKKAISVEEKKLKA